MSNYIQENLSRDEWIVKDTKYHWIHFLSFKGLFSCFIIPLIQQYSTVFVITNKRVIIKKGLGRINTVEMDLRKVETVKVDLSLFGRLLGYGDLIIIGCGGTKEHFVKINKPMLFRKAILDAATRYN
jgi:uncharacterized membrane protein YdbT with pleckstrin-like domain